VLDVLARSLERFEPEFKMMSSTQSVFLGKGFVLLVLLLVFGLSGCDFHKDEREALQRNLAVVNEERSKAQSDCNELDSQKEILNMRLSEAAENERQDKLKIEEFRQSLSGYISRHPVLTAAVAASFGGLASLTGVVDEKSRRALTGGGIAGAFVCIINTDGCKEAASTISFNFERINHFEKLLEKHSAERIDLEQSLTTLNKKRSDAQEILDQYSRQRQDLKEQIESLRCKFCLN
jgi:uncharacterized protein YlxW (UPF0749 family)